MNLRYIEPVYRPPSESESLILPVTDGCSWNRCAFCEMYTAPQKKFRARDEKEVLESIAETGARYGSAVHRIFLADGDALVLSTRRLLDILSAIKTHFPKVRRISSYCLPQNIAKKSQTEINELAAAGLKMVYVGAESGDDQVLAAVKKGETFDSTVAALAKLGTAQISRSVMILNGLGGKVWSRQHAIASAKLVNATQPEYLATLVVSFPMGEARLREGFPQWEALNQGELFAEMAIFLETLDLKKTIFRSDHASNWLVLKGVLGADKEKLLKEVENAMQNPAAANLRPAFMRGL